MSLPAHTERSSRFPFRPVRAAQRRWLVAIFITAVVLGVIGFLQLHHRAPGAEAASSGRDVLNAIYHTAQLFILHTPLFSGPVPLTLEVSRWLAALTTVLAGVAVARRMFRDELTEWRLHRVRGHTIVCGLGRKGLEQVRRLRQQGRRVVVIEKCPDPEHAEECHRLRVPIVTGDAVQPATLQEARMTQASALFVLCPDDRTNCEIAAQVSHLDRPKTAGNLECHIHLGDVDLRAALQNALSQHPDATQRAQFQFFDVFEPEARQLLVHDLPLDHDGVSVGETRQVHLVILGFGRMGRTLAVRAAQLGCFANRRSLRISVLDQTADRHREALLFRHRFIDEVCQMEFHALEAMSPAAWALLEQWCADRQSLTSVVVCFDDEPRALEIAVQLVPLLDEGRVRLAIRLAGESGLAHLLKALEREPGRRQSIQPFGMEDRWCQLFNPATDRNEVFARRIHAEYERLTAAPGATSAGATAPPAAVADELTHWLAQPEDFRESSRQQAAHIFVKLRAIGCDAVPALDPRPAVTGFAPAELEFLAGWEHDRWMAERRVANWTHAPGPKDTRRRTNPYLVPWEQVPPKVQDYDREFVRLMPRLLEAAGLKICRRGSSMT